MVPNSLNGSAARYPLGAGHTLLQAQAERAQKGARQVQRQAQAERARKSGAIVQAAASHLACQPPASASASPSPVFSPSQKTTVEAPEPQKAKECPLRIIRPSSLLFGTLIGTSTAAGTGVGALGGVIAVVVAEIYGLPNGFTGVSRLKVAAIKTAAALGITSSAVFGGWIGARASKAMVALARDAQRPRDP